jgi:hypothetical protein
MRLFTMAEYGIPVQFDYNGRKRMRHDGSVSAFSTEREFALTVNRKAIDDCSEPRRS